MAPKPIVLTVDDDPVVLSAIARDLRKEYGREYRVMRADSGNAALELVEELKATGAPVALFLSDQRMPGIDGVEFLSRAAAHYPKARRVLLTAYSDTEAAIAAIKAAQGENEEAVSGLRQAYDGGYRIYQEINLDPMFDSLRCHSESERIMSQMRADVDRMREEVLAMEAELEAARLASGRKQ